MYEYHANDHGHDWSQVYMMDKRLVDPRRPRHEKLTAGEQEERLTPYSPGLQQLSNFFVTYNRSVARLAGVLCPKQCTAACPARELHRVG